MDVWFHLHGCDFSWDAEKANATWRLRGIRFEDAAGVFLDPFFVLVDATRSDEPRDAAIGLDLQARLLFVVHVLLHDDCIRIVSARLAEPHEERLYAE
jgi:uncharacterized DUF497 family protein